MLVSLHPLFTIYLFLIVTIASHAEDLRIFTWDGYVTQEDTIEVNKRLAQSGYDDFTVKVIEPYAEGPEQMFEIIRLGLADVSFLTLNYIQMQDNKIARLLQPINVTSSRFTNYQNLSNSLKDIPMGLNTAQAPLYIPWGGGAYGIWANMDKLAANELPSSISDIWQPKWKHQLGLSIGQIQPNIVLASLAMGKAPFYLNDLAKDRKSLNGALKESSDIQSSMNALYGQVSQFWTTGPDFNDPNVSILASYGIAASAANKAGGNWQLINFKEGNSVWLDTINFHRGLKGRKLEAAEIFANYFIGKQVQERMVNELGMVAASTLVDSNPLIEQNPDFFNVKMFWPPYEKSADDIMLKISDIARREAARKQ